MSEGQFSAEDLEPSDEDKILERRAMVDRAGAAIGALAAGVWVGGMIALGACAAPFVFRLTPDPFSGNAMGAAFARFDQIALASSVILLGAEVARTWAVRANAKGVLPRIRRFLAVVMAGCAAYIGLSITPKIAAMHAAGVRRMVGPEGAVLEQVHKLAETLGKVEVVAGIALVLLHVLTLKLARPEDDDDAFSPGPLPPGPRD